MKKNYTLISSLLTYALILSIACRKSPLYSEISTDQVAIAKVPANLNFLCANAVDYGDSIIYLQSVGKNDYIINPINSNTLGKGTYFSWPSGLRIDSSTGSIDISQSEAGQRYVIGFVKMGSQDTCVQNLIMAGITYADSIYNLSADDTLALPYFNANASVASVCDSSDNNDYPGNSGHGDGDNKCVFDGTGKNGKKNQANGKNVKVRTISGVINLKATLDDGAFGSNPVNGASLIVPIYYNLNDKSNMATQLINVQLMYYDARSNIPVSVINAIEANRAAFYQNLPILFANPRPPLIIVTRRN